MIEGNTRYFPVFGGKIFVANCRVIWRFFFFFSNHSIIEFESATRCSRSRGSGLWLRKKGITLGGHIVTSRRRRNTAARRDETGKTRDSRLQKNCIYRFSSRSEFSPRERNNSWDGLSHLLLQRDEGTGDEISSRGNGGGLDSVTVSKFRTPEIGIIWQEIK